MKSPDMHQYITLQFSLLAEFFLPPRTHLAGAADRGAIPMHRCSSLRFDVLPVTVNERKALDTQCPRLVKNGVRCIVGDSGYRDKARAAACGMDGVL